MLRIPLNITISATSTLFFLTPALAQSGKTGEMVVADAGITVKAQVLMHPPKTGADQSRVYYWHRSDKIMSTRGGWEGKLLHGSYTAFYPNKNLREKGQFRYGLKTGEWTSWHENGQIKEIVRWNDGVKQGPFREYNENGELTREGRYVNDRLQGSVITYASGKTTKEETYKNGELVVRQKEDKQNRKGFFFFFKSRKQKGE